MVNDPRQNNPQRDHQQGGGGQQKPPASSRAARTGQAKVGSKAANRADRVDGAAKTAGAAGADA